MNETANFKHEADQLGCRCGCGQGGASIALLIVLEDVRRRFDAPITINSCARCEEHNRREGGSKRSEHVVNEANGWESDAADFSVQGVHESKVVAYLKQTPYANLIGIGKYKGRTHVDTRGYPARW